VDIVGNFGNGVEYLRERSESPGKGSSASRSSPGLVLLSELSLMEGVGIERPYHHCCSNRYKKIGHYWTDLRP